MAEDRRAFTIHELYELPAAVDLMTAARALHMGRTTAYELARRGEFPCRLLRYGTTYRVVTVDLLKLLGVPLPERREPTATETA
ncbi:DNA-binding protein [Nocardiopsis sp. CNT312]|uniref:DNA-binding protein n=1 Tax=Nocardiopsis sp. CNT312 TaxID=1137268 RepID=UPI0018CC0D3A|nr:DNA-binding protein [Nocardiopsis sp. CNT312]